MITRTFLFLPGIGPKREQWLWQQGITTWEKFLQAENIKGIPKAKKKLFDEKIRQAKKELYLENAAYFIDKLPKKELWRLYRFFKGEAAFLDVEVDSQGRIIVLCIFDGWESKTFVRNSTLEKQMVEKELQKYRLLVTFNGAAFDIPKIEEEFLMRLNILHIDLKPLCARLGLTGGLKEIEKQLNIPRPQHLHGHAVGLWKAFHASGDREWLELLAQYNEEDAVNLKRLMEICYKKMEERLIK